VGDDRLRLFIETVDRASAGMQSIGRTLGGLAAAYVSFQSVQRILQATIDQIGAAARAASEQEQADIKLANALRSVGESSKAAFAALTAQASALQRTTLYTDDQVQSAQTLLASLGRLTGQGLEKATEAAADLAAGLGIDLESAAQMIAKAAQGSATAFGRLGLKFDEGASKAEIFSKVMGFVATNFGGRAAAAADSFAGRIEAVTKQFGELQEALGKNIIASPEFNAMLVATADSLSRIAASISDSALTDLVGALTLQFVRFAQAQVLAHKMFLAFAVNLPGVGSAFQALRGPLLVAEAELNRLAAALESASRFKSDKSISDWIDPLFPKTARDAADAVSEWDAMMSGGNWVRGLDEAARQIERMNVATPPATLAAIALRDELEALAKIDFRDAWQISDERTTDWLPPLDNIEAFTREFEKLNGLQQNMVNLAAQFGAELATAALQGEIKLGQMLRKIIAALIAAVIQAAVLAAIVVAISGGSINFGTAFRGALGIAGSTGGGGSGGQAANSTTGGISLSGVPTIGGGTPVAPTPAGLSLTIAALGTEPSFLRAVVDATTQIGRQYGVAVEVVGG
jgi:hypothetical protein